MKTRSQTRKEVNTDSNVESNVESNERVIYEVNIDFDEASRAWRSNKKSMGNGQYKYVCISEKVGIKCGKVCYKDLSCCWQHRNQKSK
jgi:hypothetical protein